MGAVQWAPQCAAEALALEDHMVETPVFADVVPVAFVPYPQSPTSRLSANDASPH